MLKNPQKKNQKDKKKKYNNQLLKNLQKKNLKDKKKNNNNLLLKNPLKKNKKDKKNNNLLPKNKQAMIKLLTNYIGSLLDLKLKEINN